MMMMMIVSGVASISYEGVTKLRENNLSWTQKNIMKYYEFVQL